MNVLRATSPCFNCLMKRFPVHLKQFNLFTTPRWNMLCYFNCAPCLHCKGSKDSIRREVLMNFSQQPLVLGPNYENSMTPTVIERDEWWWSQILKLPFPYSRVLFHLRFSMKRFCFFFFSRQKSRACAEVNNVQDEWQRTVEIKSTFQKSTPTQFQALSPREISRRAEGSQWLHIHSQAVWSFTTSNKMTNSCDGKLFSPNFLLALKRSH